MRQVKSNAGPAVAALGSDPPAVRFDKFTGDRETYACSPMITGTGAVCAEKSFEDKRKIGSGNFRAGIAKAYFN